MVRSFLSSIRSIFTVQSVFVSLLILVIGVLVSFILFKDSLFLSVKKDVLPAKTESEHYYEEYAPQASDSNENTSSATILGVTAAPTQTQKKTTPVSAPTSAPVVQPTTSPATSGTGGSSASVPQQHVNNYTSVYVAAISRSTRCQPEMIPQIQSADNEYAKKFDEYDQCLANGNQQYFACTANLCLGKPDYDSCAKTCDEATKPDCPTTIGTPEYNALVSLLNQFCE